MSNTVRIAAGVAAIALATVAGVALLSGGGIGAAPSPRPTPTPLALPAAERPGPVEAGTYVAGDPFPVRVTVTLPAGWNGNIGGPYGVFLEQAQGPGAVSFEIFDKVYADPCHYDKGPLSPLPGPSVNELATALASLPGIEATTPTDVTVAGYQGKQLTLTAPASFAGCTLGPKDTSVIWALPLGATFEMVPGQRTRVWILNVAGKRLVIDSPDLTGQAEAQADEAGALRHFDSP